MRNSWSTSLVVLFDLAVGGLGTPLMLLALPSVVAFDARCCSPLPSRDACTLITGSDGEILWWQMLL